MIYSMKIDSTNMDPTQEQLNARLNPQPFHTYLPAEGITTDQDRQVLYLPQQDGSISALYINSILTPEEQQQANLSSGSALGAYKMATERLKSQYGFDINTLRTVNKADLEQSLISQGKITTGGTAMFNPGKLDDFLKAKPGTLQTQTQNTQGSQLAPQQVAYNNQLQTNPQANGLQVAAQVNPQVYGQMAQRVGQPAGQAAPQSSYTGPSIVDYLKSVGQPADFASRAMLAKEMGITGYTGSRPQNDQLLSMLRAGQSGSVGTPQRSLAPESSTAGSTPDSLLEDTETPDDLVARILGEYGIDSTGKFGANPMQSFESIYQNLYNNMGLDRVKSNIDSMLAEIKVEDEKLAEDIRVVNENPWISEGLRSKKIGGLQEKYESRKGALTDRLQLLQSTFDKAREEAQFIAQQSMSAYYKERELQQDLLFKAMDRAEKELDLKAKAGEKKYGAGIVGEYQFYVEDALSRGQTPVSFVEYQNQDANRKLKATGSVSSQQLLSPTEAAALGVPYGTTREEAFGKTPQKPATDAQKTVATYAARLEQSGTVISNLEAALSGMNAASFEAQKRLPSYLQSGDYQQFDQAARNFINATLRRESGAVISPSEFDNAYKQYLPRPGDTEQTLKQKKENRDVVFASFKNSAGPAYQSVEELLSGETNGGGSSQYPPGSVISVGNVMYLVGADGESLEPIGSSM